MISKYFFSENWKNRELEPSLAKEPDSRATGASQPRSTWSESSPGPGTISDYAAKSKLQHPTVTLCESRFSSKSSDFGAPIARDYTPDPAPSTAPTRRCFELAAKGKNSIYGSASIIHDALSFNANTHFSRALDKKDTTRLALLD